MENLSKLAENEFVSLVYGNAINNIVISNEQVDDPNKIVIPECILKMLENRFQMFDEFEIEEAFKISEIIPGLYLSGVYQLYNPEAIGKHNIKNIVNFFNSESNVHSDVNYLNMIIIDGCWQVIADDMFFQVFKFIDSALERGEKVLLHCEKGFSRSPTFVVAYLMYKFDYDFDQALITVSKKRYIRINDSFRYQLIRKQDLFRKVGSPEKYKFSNWYISKFGYHNGSPIYHFIAFVFQFLRNKVSGYLK